MLSGVLRNVQMWTERMGTLAGKARVLGAVERLSDEGETKRDRHPTVKRLTID